MSKEHSFDVVSPFDGKLANLWLALAITMNGGSMKFPRSAFESMGSVEVFVNATDDDDTIVISLEPYYEH